MASYSHLVAPIENQTRTHEYNFAPSEIVAQASLNGVVDPGRAATGIAGYRYRPHPDGAEMEVKFPAYDWWPSTVHHTRMSSVTFGYSIYDSSLFQTLWNVFFW